MSKRRRHKGNSDPSFKFNMDEVIRDVARMQMATQHIPAMVAQEVRKSWKQIPNTDPARSPKSWMHDPLSLQYSLGYKDRRFSITYDTCKRVAGQLGVISSIINTRAAQVSAFSQPYRWTKSLGYTVKHKDPDHRTTSAEMEFIKELEYFVLRCGRSEKNPYARVERDDFEAFLRKIVRDSLTYDQVCVEVVPDGLGIPFEFWAVDASTIRIAADDRYVGVNSSYHSRDGFVPSMPSRFANLYDGRKYGETNAGDRPVGYVQVIQGQIENVYSPDELAFGVRNPRTDIYIQGYGYGELEQVITIVTAYLNAERYNQTFFTQGSAPKGLLNLKGDNYTQEMLEGFRRQWLAQVSGVENCIAGDSVIWTKEAGATSVASFVGDESEKLAVIWTGDSWRSGLVYKTKEPKSLCLTTLNNGVTVHTSPDHKFLVLGDSGEPCWKAQADLEIGDYVCINRNSVDGCVETKIPQFAGKRLTPDMLEVLGWMTGDGYLTFGGHGRGKPNYLQLFYHHDKEQDIRDKHVRILQDFGLPAEPKTKVLSSEQAADICERYGFNTVSQIRISIDVFSFDFVEWLVGLGFQPSAKGKVIPGFIHILPEEYRTAFLRGFFSADGWNAKLRTPGIVITNDTLRAQTRLLLLSIGIRTSLSEGKQKLVILNKDRSYVDDAHLLRIKDRDAFFQKVGFLQAHKQPTAAPKNEIERGKTDRVSSGVLTRYCRYLQKETKGTLLLSKEERLALAGILCGHDGCSRPRLQRFFDMAQIPSPSWLWAYNFEPVVGIERTSDLVDMYDVSIDDHEHKFIVNGVCTHNSWRTPILQSEGIEWIDLNKSNQEMEFGRWLEYLLKIVCGVYLIDPAEVNFEIHGGQQQTPLFEASQEWKLKASRDRGLKPLLKFLAKMINRHIIAKIDDHFTFEFVGLDEMSENEKHEMLVEQISSYMTLNEARRSLDLSDLPYGDIPMNPVYLQAMTTQQQAQMNQQQMAGQPGGEAPDQQGLDQQGPPNPDEASDDSEPKYSDNFGFDNNAGKQPDVGAR